MCVHTQTHTDAPVDRITSACCDDDEKLRSLQHLTARLNVQYTDPTVMKYTHTHKHKDQQKTLKKRIKNGTGTDDSQLSTFIGLHQNVDFFFKVRQKSKCQNKQKSKQKKQTNKKKHHKKSVMSHYPVNSLFLPVDASSTLTESSREGHTWNRQG